MLSVKKNRMISRNLSLNGVSEGPMTRGAPLIVGVCQEKLTQNMPDSYLWLKSHDMEQRRKIRFRNGQLV